MNGSPVARVQRATCPEADMRADSRPSRRQNSCGSPAIPVRAVTGQRHPCRRSSRIPRWQAFNLELKAGLGGDSRPHRSELQNGPRLYQCHWTWAC